MPYNNREYVPKYISGITGTQVFTGKGTLHAVVVNTTTATAFGIYDTASGTATGTIALLKSSVVEGPYEYDASISNGLYITCGSSGDYTVLYTKG